MLAITGKRVLITGGSGRLGRKLAAEFAGNGAKVCVHYNKSKEAVSKLENVAGAVRAEISDVRQVGRAVDEAVKILGGLDILINSAGVFCRTPIEETGEADWNNLMDVNLRAPFFFAKFATPFLQKSGTGRIINIADTYGVSPSAGFVPYGVSKAGLIAMTKGLAKELAPEVLVNCVCPGVISSEIDQVDKLTRLTSLQAEEKRRAIGATLLKRAVDIEDVVSAILFMARNGSMTGQMIYVDGGHHI